MSARDGGELGIGIIGCGNISTTYLTLAPLFAGIEMRACADLSATRAAAQAEAFGIRATTVPELLADPAIDIVVNLTVPDAHAAVSEEALRAGKHVYSEKPVVLNVEDGARLRALADARGLLLGAAPDTFLGGAHQLARAHLDAGGIGRVTSGTAHVMSHGMEHWHPQPDFFYQPGGGPMLDLGPYYIASLISLLGSVRRVAALANMASDRRRISSAPRAGEVIPVGTPTNIHALLDFDCGAAITLSASWDVWAHRHGPLELYGTEGALFLPDPNFFGGEVAAAGVDGVIAPLEPSDHPFGRDNQEHPQGMRANYRVAGLADMARAIRQGGDFRCSFDRALHAVEVMTAALASGAEGRFVAMTTRCTRPDALDPAAARNLLRAS